MDQASLQSAITMLWQNRDKLVSGQQEGDQAAIAKTLDLLDRGVLRVAERGNDEWIVHQWVKQAILLSFRIMPNVPLPGAGGAPVFDKVAMKFNDWDTNRFAEAGIRAVPGAVVRHSAHISRGAVLMPCFINVGARVGEDTMIDTWSTVGSCAQVGRNCHISGGVGIGGVLEPLQANPVIIEDDCFIGARSEVAEGVIVERGAVLSMGVFLGASTRIIDRATGDVTYGRVPAYSVVVPGSMPGKPLPDGSQGPSLACAVIVKRVDAQTRSKTAINELLRA
ncbi:2,3,4,5-tetrahydropyridine-2,6-dicarboxylate N-succinyltransferase [Acidiphilium sp. PA]|uniref:2,3,4,5-tetrahydropyridine-2,6-dicarboxylate N-succinyltransferase n=1 Tax=Acidiphilium sp. PA TaxID=2871705 RepID=UPI0022446E92|nr:2,3,4,5-tetrahydropyridine-2,6-dicarboxylate N-succinyltransferase [Acidiphilium sp. PA]MCW8308306.1 2,3,4,5-tetrahydropyridine-2,6-dicarboxylate N-succinyltransferase [Acidiphilium sp. PA]